MYKYFLGLKYLLSRPINLLGTFGVMVAVWALVVIISVFSGFIREVRGHIRGGLADLTLLDDSLTTSYAEIEELLLADRDVAAVAPRIQFPALVYPEKSRQRDHYLQVGDRDTRTTPLYQVVGIDFARESKLSLLPEWLDAVRDPKKRVRALDHPFRVDPARLGRSRAGDFGQVPPAILLGQGRTRYPGAGLPTLAGDEVVLATVRKLPGGGLEPVKKILVVNGTFRAERHREIEATRAFVDIETARAIDGNDPDDPDSLDVTTEVSIALRDVSRAAAVKDRLNRALAAHGLPAGVVTWQERKATFLRAVEYERGVMKLVLFVLMIVASFLIFATVSMMVTKKTRDIGIISALGGTRRGVLAIFLVSGSVIALIGAALGIATGYVSCLWLNDVNHWLERYGYGLFPKAIYGLREIPIDVEPLWVLQVALGAALSALLFSLGPALRAARLDPVQALRYE